MPWCGENTVVVLYFTRTFSRGSAASRHPRRARPGRAGFVNEVEEFWYEAATFSTATPGDEFFTNVNTLNCSKHAHAEAPDQGQGWVLEC